MFFFEDLKVMHTLFCHLGTRVFIIPTNYLLKKSIYFNNDIQCVTWIIVYFFHRTCSSVKFHTRFLYIRDKKINSLQKLRESTMWWDCSGILKEEQENWP